MIHFPPTKTIFSTIFFFPKKTRFSAKKDGEYPPPDVPRLLLRCFFFVGDFGKLPGYMGMIVKNQIIRIPF